MYLSLPAHSDLLLAGYKVLTVEWIFLYILVVASNHIVVLHSH